MSTGENYAIVKAQPAQVPNVAPITAPDEPEHYRQGYEGMALAPVGAHALDVLRRPVDPDAVEIKPDGIVYLPGVFYRSRLNEAFGPGAWAMPPRGPARRMPKSGGELVVFNGALFILGRFVSERMGHCMYYPSNNGMTFADAYEGAITDCLSRCCKDIIPGVEVLWERGWRDEWTQRYAEKGDDNKWRRKGSLRTSKLSPSVTPPTVQSGAGDAGNVPPVAPGPSVSAPPVAPANASAPMESDADTGEIATDEQLDALETLAFKTLKLTHEFAGKWMQDTFGTRDPSSLTIVQVKRAMELLPTVKP